MRKLSGAILILTALSAAMLFAVPAVSAADETVKIYYKADPDIDMDIPREIKKGDDLTIKASSNKYDLEKSGIMFFECDPSGKPIRTTSLSLIFSSVSENNTVTLVFSDVRSDIEVSFTELVKLETPPVVPGEDVEPGGTDEQTNAAAVPGLELTTMIMFAIVILGGVMLAIMVWVKNMLAPFSETTVGRS